MSQQFNEVVEFNQDVLKIGARGHKLQDPEEFQLSFVQLQEESSEFLEACNSGDYIGAVDACIDSIVFAMGILYKLGLTDEEFETCFTVVMAANMNKRKGVKAGREGFNAEDAVKPEGWIAPEEILREILSE